jgi:predicted Fe-S protein YdhL (DUF1289 family)
MQAAQAKSVRPGYPPSPCIRQCVLNDVSECLGCGRSIDEIVGWTAMSAAEQWAVVNRLRDR